MRFPSNEGIKIGMGVPLDPLSWDAF